MTPREPDRFDAKAREIVAAFIAREDLGMITDVEPFIAAALRAAESSALERAAQTYDSDAEQADRESKRAESEGEGMIAATHSHEGCVARSHAIRLRSMIPPAAAPAAEERNDPCQRCGKLGGHPVDFSFDGILMGSWICPHCLAAQEKRIDQMEAAIRWACGERPLPDGRWFDPEAFGHVRTIPRFWWRSVLYQHAGLSAAPPKEPPST